MLQRPLFLIGFFLIGVLQPLFSQQNWSSSTFTDPITLCADDPVSRNTFGSIIGLNLLNYNEIPSSININDICSYVRYFHLMDGDSLGPGGDANGRDFTDKWPSIYSPTVCTTTIPSPINAATSCYTCSDPLQMGSMRARYCLAKQNGAPKIYATIETLINGNFPDKMFSASQWGANEAAAFNNARSYGKKFAENYCPKDNTKACLVDVLELGNEPWGMPGTSYYRAVYRGIIHGVSDYYNTTNPTINYTNTYTIPTNLDTTTWRMKISTGAYQAFVSSNIHGTNDTIGTIPTDIWRYAQAVNVHPYSFPFTRNTSGQITGLTFNNMTLHPESKDGYFLTLLNAIKWRNTNQAAKKIGLTEFGWDSEIVGQNAQAIYLVRSLLMLGRMDFDQAVIYELFDNPSLFSPNGLYKTSGLMVNATTPKPAFHAVKRLKRLLGNKIFLKKLNSKDYEDTNNGTTNNYFAYVVGGTDRKPTHLVVWVPKNINFNNNLNNDTATITINNFPTGYSINTSANSRIIKINTNSGNTEDSLITNQIVSIVGSTVSIKASSTPYLIPLNTTAFTYPAPTGNIVINTCAPCNLAAPIITNNNATVTCNQAATLAATCTGSSILWTLPGGATSTASSIPVNTSANGVYTYSAVCTTGACTSNPATTAVTVSGCAQPPCILNNVCLLEAGPFNIACGTPHTYTYTATAATAVSNIIIDFTGVPSSQINSLTASVGTITDLYLPPNSTRYVRWTIPSVTANQSITATLGFCWVPNTPPPAVVATITSHTGCTAVTATSSCSVNPPIVTSSVNTVTSPTQSFTLTATGCTGGTINWVQGTTGTGTPKTISGISATTTYKATCTIGGITSAQSVGTTVTYSTCSPTVDTNKFIKVISGTKKYYISKQTVAWQSVGTAYDTANKRCKALHPNARLATIPDNTVNTDIKTTITNRGLSSNVFYIGYNSNASSIWSWLGGTSTYLPAGFTTTATANQAVQFVNWNPGWAQNNKNVTSNFVCEVPCENGSSNRVIYNGSEMNETKSLLKLYPNPVSGDILNIEFESEQNEEVTVTVITSTNQVIDQYKLATQKGVNKRTIDVSKLSSAVYFVIVTPRSGTTQKATFVVE